MLENFLKNRVFCDSNTIIALNVSCLLWILKKLYEDMGKGFAITPEVYKEVVENSLKYPQYMFEPFRLFPLINEKVIVLVNVQDEKEKREIEEIKNELMNIANRMFYVRKRNIEVLHKGEAEILAYSIYFKKRLFFTDERVLKELIEDPNSLKSTLERRLHEKVEFKREKWDDFKDLIGNIKVARSIDLISYCYLKGYFDEILENSKEFLKGRDYKKKFLFGLLFLLKRKGCGVSIKEIEKYVETLLKIRG